MSPSPMSLLKQVHLEQAAQDPIQAAFKYLQRRRLHNLFGQSAPVTGDPHSKDVFHDAQTELSLFQFVSVASLSLIKAGCNSFCN